MASLVLGADSMLWTIVPQDVLADDDDSTLSVAEMSVGATTIVVQIGDDGTGTIQRVLSTNPADYLRPEWQPGAVWRGAALPRRVRVEPDQTT